MSARGPAPPDADWWAPHVVIAAFVALVAVILVAVPGWSAPLHAWIALAACVIAVLACHAAARAMASAWRRRWRLAVVGLLLATTLGLVAAAMLLFGRWCQAGADDRFADTPARAGEVSR